MTYDHYVQWQKYAAKKIAEAMEAFSLKRGDNTVVLGNSVGIDVAPVPDTAPTLPTWRYIIYGTIQTQPGNTQFGPYLAATLPRADISPQIVQNDSLFVDSTQVVSFPDTGLNITKKITYFVTTAEPGQTTTTNFDKGVFRGGLKLICEFFEQPTSGPAVFVRNYNLFVGRNGDSVTLTAPEPYKFYYLRIASVERL